MIGKGGSCAYVLQDIGVVVATLSAPIAPASALLVQFWPQNLRLDFKSACLIPQHNAVQANPTHFFLISFSFSVFRRATKQGDGCLTIHPSERTP
ncbi:hypothetical protein QC762_0107520 [Podospora pseudocomata]|uniref:Uncharacterized protein n=1 Tax=Podospora pseudocomata TaxID=2093779 RepID=A0ABR0G384_9PEZI|nr:hypothetical protein QC762_0107520 [Podospora pseudocomata]